MEHLQSLCLGTVLSKSLEIAQTLVTRNTVTFAAHASMPMRLAVAFRRPPVMSDEDMDTYAFLSTTGAKIPRDLGDRYLGYRVESLRGWDKVDDKGRADMVSPGDVGAVMEMYSCQYDDMVLVDVMLRDDPGCCIHTEVPYAELPGEGLRREYLVRPWRRLLLEDSCILQHPVLPRRTVLRNITERLWPLSI